MWEEIARIPDPTEGAGGTMVAMQHEATISITLIRILLKYIAREGFDPSQILDDVGIHSSIVEDNDARISIHHFASIWQAALEKTEDHNFGLHFGKELADNYTGGHILFNVMKNCPTVGAAFEKFCQYHNLMADAIQPKMETERDIVCLTWEVSDPEIRIPRHISEALIATYVYLLRHITENRLKLIEARFQHPHPGDIHEHKAIIGAPLVFDQLKNELVFEKKYLDLPVFLANSELLEALEGYAKKVLNRLYAPNTWSEKVVRLQGELFVRGDKPTIETVAKNLAMSPRKLQKILKEEGTTYQKILDHVREEFALSYLGKEETTICDIAFLLGYSEQSAFNHAFKRWTGSTPREYRRRM